MANRRAEGSTQEDRARAFLERAGLRFIDANIGFRSGEIDLLMEHGDTLVFVEVRARNNPEFGGAAASVGPRKQRRLATAAGLVLARHPRWQQRPCRFDVVAIDAGEIQWIRDAFQPAGQP